MGEKVKRLLILSIVLFVLLIAFISTHIIVLHVKERRENEELQRQVQVYNEMKIETYEVENAKFDDYEVDVVFLGDSLTDGYDLEKYYPEYLVLNRGIGGNTTFDLESRLEVSAYDTKPKVVVMLIGANNFHTMFENYEDILKGLKENLPNTKVVLLSLTAMGGDHWGRNNGIAIENNVKIKVLADEYGFEFVDLFSPLYDIETEEVYEGYTTDGGHFTEEGYEVVTSVIKPVLEDVLNQWNVENQE